MPQGKIPDNIFNLITGRIPVPIYIFNSEFEVVYCNDETSRFGTSGDLGRNLKDFSLEVQEVWEPLLRKCLDTKVEQLREGWITSRLRGRCFWSIACVPLEDNLVVLTVIDRTAGERTQEALAEAQHQLSENEWRFHTMIEEMSECVILTNAQSEIIFANQATERLAGCPRGELLGRQIYELIPEDKHGELQRHRESLLTGQNTVHDMEIRTLSGEKRRLHVWTSPRFDSQGEWIGSFTLAQDTTEEHRALEIQAMLLSISEATSLSDSLEELIQIIHHSLGSLIDATNFFVALYDPESEIYTFPYYIDERDQEFEPQRMPRSLTEYVRKTGQAVLADEAKQAEMYEEGLIDFYGPTSPVWLGVPLRTARGILGVVAVQDYYKEYAYTEADLRLLSFVSGYIALAIERKRAEEILRESEEKYRKLVNEMAEGMSIANAQGVFEYVNPALEEIFGVEPGGLYGRRILDFVTPDQYSIYETQISMRRQRMSSAYEMQITRPDGNKRDILVSATPRLSANGRYIGTASLVQNITERKAAEREQERLRMQMLQAQKMESLGRLAGGIAHDFNNILLAVLGNIELSRVELPKDSPIQRNLDEVVMAVGRAKELVQQVLTLSRQREPRRQPVELHKVINEVLRLIRAGMPSTVEIRHINLTSSDVVMADPAQLHQVLMNLCTNANQAMEDRGGLLEVVLSETELRRGQLLEYPNQKPGPYLVMSVSDTGCGIPAEIVSKIFEPFFTTKKIGIGTGLGLAVVQGIITNHAGAIVVESEVGQGTTFRLFLPKADQQIIAETKQNDDVVTGSGKVLFVDDDDAPLRVGQRMLRHMGFETVATGSSEEALRIFTDSPYDFSAIITDLTMPGITGLELIEAARAIRPEIPCVLCTGFDPHVDVDRANNLHISELIAKPYGMSELGSALRRALAGKKSS
ncbi:PAS domain-containing protein [bacterium]|nr:PAS domain-containing protein [bacterium]